jgi:hypothetical protein
MPNTQTTLGAAREHKRGYWGPAFCLSDQTPQNGSAETRFMYPEGPAAATNVGYFHPLATPVTDFTKAAGSVRRRQVAAGAPPLSEHAERRQCGHTRSVLVRHKGQSHVCNVQKV